MTDGKWQVGYPLPEHRTSSQSHDLAAAQATLEDLASVVKNDRRREILLIGCEPAPLESEEGQMGMSEPVQRAVDEAVGIVESLVAKILGDSTEPRAVATGCRAQLETKGFLDTVG